MAPQHVLTSEFTEVVDNLVHDAAVSDSALHSRAQQYLEVFKGTNQVEVKPWPPWAERIHKASPQQPTFTTPDFFNVIYQVADELRLMTGRRYVSAAICVCGESVARVSAVPNPSPEQQAADLAQALHQLSSTWVAFLLWPFYAYANEYREREEDPPPASGDETPTAESIAREHRRCWKEQVMARDDYRCFMCGGIDSRAYDAGRAIPEGSRLAFCYTVPIISPEVWTRTQHVPEDHRCQSDQRLPRQEITLGILARFCGIDTSTLIEKAHDGPLNALFVNSSSENTFRKLLWCLHPSDTPDRYEIRSYGSPVYVGCDHITTHVTFVDHSASGAGVDLPDRELLRAHAALAGVLHRSAVRDVFRFLRYYLPSAYRGAGRAIYPAPTGAAFWRSLVEYAGPDVSLEVQVWCDSKAEPESESGSESEWGQTRGCAVSS